MVKEIRLAGGQVRQVGWVGDYSYLVFSQKFSPEKGNVRPPVVMKQQPVFIAEVQGEVLAKFHTVPIKRHSNMLNFLFGMQEQVLCEKSS